MSASKPATKAELKAYCLRRLGYPAVDINICDEQLDDLKTVIDYVIDTEADHYDEWLQESTNDQDDLHIYAMAINASRIEIKEIV